MLRDRVFSGILLLALVLLIIAFRDPLLLVGVAGAALIGVFEFYNMARKGGYSPWVVGGLLLTLAFVVEAALVRYAWRGPSISLALVLLVLLGGLLVAVAGGQPPPAAWANAGLTVAGALYIGGLLRYALLFPQDAPPGEVAWMILILVGTAGSDTGAYFVGRAWGKRKLIPHISPGKTWVGLWGGMAVAVAGTALLAGVLRIPAWHVIPLGIALNLASVAGDLAESMLKRAFGAKDSGTWIPGHGGLLDRLDSFLFVLAVVYFYSAFFYYPA
jgi:phosphatidate cytidylyltransferase